MVAGRVIDTAGAPVAGALVAFEGAVPFPEMPLRTDADGRFRIRLPAAPFTVTAHHRTGRAAPVEIGAAEEDIPPLVLGGGAD